MPTSFTCMLLPLLLLMQDPKPPPEATFRPSLPAEPLAPEQRPLAGKVALVTGATSGLGLEASAELARLGAKVIFGVRSAKKADAVAKQIRER